MTDLVVHIGLPKTATTTIQRHLLPGNPGYCREWGESSKKQNFERDFLNIFRAGPNLWEGRLAEWASALYQAFDPKTSDRIILSNEQLSGMDESILGPDIRWPIGTFRQLGSLADSVERRPIVPFLKSLNDIHWPHGRVKVLIVFRNQADWLASLYAQTSRKFRRASQADFEEQIEGIIGRGEHYIDWSGWVDALGNALGRENVEILFMEDIKEDRFWDCFSDFMGIAPDRARTFIGRAGSRENVRKSDADTWSLDRYRKGRFDWGRGKQITLHAALRARIMAHCRIFNERLALQVGRGDLRALGYLPTSP